MFNFVFICAQHVVKHLLYCGKRWLVRFLGTGNPQISRPLIGYKCLNNMAGAANSRQNHGLKIESHQKWSHDWQNFRSWWLPIPGWNGGGETFIAVLRNSGTFKMSIKGNHKPNYTCFWTSISNRPKKVVKLYIWFWLTRQMLFLSSWSCHVISV